MAKAECYRPRPKFFGSAWRRRLARAAGTSYLVARYPAAAALARLGAEIRRAAGCGGLRHRCPGCAGGRWGVGSVLAVVLGPVARAVPGGLPGAVPWNKFSGLALSV